MKNIRRKHVMIAYPLLFSLCALPPPSLESISLQELLIQSPDTAAYDLTFDLSPSPFFDAQPENCDSVHYLVTLPFPTLFDTASSLQQGLFLSNVPIYVSYLDYTLSQEKRKLCETTFSPLPPLFYTMLSQRLPSFLADISQPNSSLHPAEETVALDTLLHPDNSYLTELTSIDSSPKEFKAELGHTPLTSHAPPLATDKVSLKRSSSSSFPKTTGHLSSLQGDSALSNQARKPSTENIGDKDLSLQDHLNPLQLTEIPITYTQSLPNDMPREIGKLLSTQSPSISDLIPLSFFYSHSLPPTTVVASSFKQEVKPRIFAPSPGQETKEFPLNIEAPLLSLDKETVSQPPSFEDRKEAFASQSITSSPVLVETLLPRNYSFYPSTKLQLPLCLEESRLDYSVPPSFESSVRFSPKTFVFIPHTKELIPVPTPAFVFGPTEISSQYTYCGIVVSPTIHTYPDPYESDPLVKHLALHKIASCLLPDLSTPLLVGHFPSAAPAIDIPYSLSVPLLENVVDSSFSSAIAFKDPHNTFSYSLKDPQDPFIKIIPLHLAENRSASIIDDLETLALSSPLYNEESSFLGCVMPAKEPRIFAKMNDYPFLQEFYSQIPDDLSPFLFFYDAHAIPLTSALSLPYEKPSCDVSLYAGALALIEPLGLEQTFTLSITPNSSWLTWLDPNYETLSAITWRSAAIPDPQYFGVSYQTARHFVRFPESTAKTSERFIATSFQEVAKKDLLPGESLLSTSLETIPHQLECSTEINADLLAALAHLSPNRQTSLVSAEPPSISPALQYYSLRVDKYQHPLMNLPSLLASTSLSPSLVTNNIDLCPSRKTAATLNKTSRNTQENLAQLPSLQELHTLSLSDEFQVDVQVMQNTKGPGYLFSITLEPTAGKMISDTPQNFIFLVDRSSSIDKNRFQIFKQAINKALPYLKEQDTFNVLSFDTEISKMSHDSVAATSSTKHAARRFLETQKRGYKYVVPNLYKILLSVHQMVKESPLPTTVVLLTNGKSLENFNTQDEQLSRLISTNEGGFTLFTACASHNNNTLMLEILSNLNRGEFMHSQTNAAFPRKLAAFVKHAGHLIAKDIHVSAASSTTDLDVAFFPDTTSSPNLYGDRPYTIIGKIDKLSDFDLVLQGRVCNNWINVTKKVSFTTARHGSHAIYKDYTMHMAYNKYREFLKEGNTACLDEAKKVLQPLNGNFTY